MRFERRGCECGGEAWAVDGGGEGEGLDIVSICCLLSTGNSLT